ncbi:hypothetical protein Gasu2_25450 [Galdieria sulphuraria]|nr:hypothetical protein Gasu2_25450 [Galdieria sulphuraria]
MVFLWKGLQIDPLGSQLVRAQLSKNKRFFVLSHKRNGLELYNNKKIMRTFCQQGESPSNPPGFEDNWIRREEAEIAALLEHDFRIDIDPRKIDWPPTELRYDPEELQRRYAPHISYDPVPLSSENLPILWDTPRNLSLVRHMDLNLDLVANDLRQDIKLMQLMLHLKCLRYYCYIAQFIGSCGSKLDTFVCLLQLLGVYGLPFNMLYVHLRIVGNQRKEQCFEHKRERFIDHKSEDSSIASVNVFFLIDKLSRNFLCCSILKNVHLED